jgi:Mrp family chromosome partitioning ATPase/DUF971 family protein
MRDTLESSVESFSKVSPPSKVHVPTEWRAEILTRLSKIMDPDLNRDIVSLGFIKNLGLKEDERNGKSDVSFDVELTTPACPVKELFKQQCEEALVDLSWIDNIDVRMTASESEVTSGGLLGVNQVKAIVAVSSCKGGVGKSTTAVNLAFALQSLGAEVGILDVDVYGPSLPTMIKPDNENVVFVDRQIAPLQRNGVRLMSFGYINEGAAIMRGAMVTQLLDQLLTLTNWGPLDYLILDMPPGTGDIQLSLCQRLNITAAVIVTTPQELSFVDVMRGIEMFDTVNVPSIAVVENMAYLEVEKQQSEPDFDHMYQSFLKKLEKQDTDEVSTLAQDLVQIVRQQTKDIGKKEQVQMFGKGHKHRLSNQYGIEKTFSLPLLPSISRTGDSGTPFILQYPNSTQSATFKELASSVASEISKIQYFQKKLSPQYSYDTEAHAIVQKIQQISTDKEQISTISSMPPAALRRECKCASCVEEFTGKILLRPETIKDNIKPLKMNSCGNYALSINWSDGHHSLYPYRQLQELMDLHENT